MNESIDDCIMRRRRECTEPIWHTVPYLCGNDKMCLKKFETTIQETKQAIDKNYLVLGVLEELKVVTSKIGLIYFFYLPGFPSRSATCSTRLFWWCTGTIIAYQKRYIHR